MLGNTKYLIMGPCLLLASFNLLLAQVLVDNKLLIVESESLASSVSTLFGLLGPGGYLKYSLSYTVIYTVIVYYMYQIVS